MFYLLNKPKGISSFKHIKKFSNQLNIKKIGHTGTLDPLASGLMLVATDEDTRLIPYINDKTKKYRTVIQFGQATSTYDSEGEITFQSSQKIENDDLTKILNWFQNQTVQIPPIFSAKKINGVRSYNLARNNSTNIELKPQNIQVSEVKFIHFDYLKQQLTIELKVSNGTYIRSLANDIGIFMNTYSYMLELERIEISSLSKKELENQNYVAIINILPFLSLKKLSINEQQLNNLLAGKIINLNVDDDLYLIFYEAKYSQQPLGIVQAQQNQIKVKKMFGTRIQQRG